eukprot:CAMPEP_0115831164 /NCGR_PEP_ID=MMETSP0287-20121206/1997_1 /TAXON_ID=412157 /ORGANISM="Chrysochromulina rotalis, Strain UIO044" /LENGTH=268 /DNA_ID=CAMNT_0003284501 /DNA_START=189 /DNA_END=992 /DNA_ORIENTATION=-
MTICDDGGEGSYDHSHPRYTPYTRIYHHKCEYGTDCTDCGPRRVDFPPCECCAVIYSAGPGDFCGRASFWELNNWTCTECHDPDTAVTKDELCGKVSYDMAQRFADAGLEVESYAYNGSSQGYLDHYFRDHGAVELGGRMGGEAQGFSSSGFPMPLGYEAGYRDPVCGDSRLVASPEPTPFLGIEGLNADDELMFLHLAIPPLPPRPPATPPLPPFLPPSPASPSPAPPPFPPNRHSCMDLIPEADCRRKLFRNRCFTEYNQRNCQRT